MNHKFIRKLLLFNFVFVLVLTSNLGRADDIEIYFNSAASSNNVDVIRSNVLFILDTSGSMSITASSGQTRLQDMKDAMEVVLSNLEDVNVGLMRFKRNDGGTILFPVTNIDGAASDVVGDIGEAFVTEIVSTAFIQDDLDDGEEIITSGGGPPINTVSLADATLDAFDFGGTQSVAGGQHTFPIVADADDGMEITAPGDLTNFFFGCCNGSDPVMMNGNAPRSGNNRDGIWIHRGVLTGLRFQGVTIPNGQTITDAFIRLTARRNDTNNANTRIVGQATDNAPAMSGFNAFGNDISTRAQTAAVVPWNGIPATSNNQSSPALKADTPPITTIVQEIVNRPGWSSGNAMFFRFQADETLNIGPGDNGFQSSITRGATPNNARRRFRDRFEFNPSNPNATAPAELHIQTAGSGTAVQGQDQRVALRFTDLQIPQGATLTEAKLVLTPNAAPVSAVQSVWRVRAEQVDNSAPLVSTLSNISNRPVDGGATVNWTVGAGDLITVDEPEESVDISNALQSVISRAGWCGGNALTLVLDTASADVNQTRFLHSHDSDSSKAPKLTYKFAAGQTGCVKKQETAQTVLSGDDAEQFGVDVDTIDNDLDIGFDIESGSEQTVGLRFRDIDVPNGATILDAEMIFTSRGVSTGDAIFTIKGIDEDNVSQFSNTPNDISNRTTTTEQVSWDAEEWDTGATSFATDDIKLIVQEIVNRGGWASGNTMGFVIESNCGAGTCNSRIAETSDGDGAKAPRLKITYQSILETPFVTSRQRLIEIIRGLPADGFTPITPTLVEAARYWRGENVVHGKSRSFERRNRLSHPGSYCTSAGSGNCNGASIDSSTDSFGVRQNGSCNLATNPDGNNCALRNIKGNPSYLSPFTSTLSCATNHQVVLTDGAANSSGNSNRNYIRALPGVGSCVTNNTTIARPGEIVMNYIIGEICAPELARFMNENDQSTTLASDQNVKTHTIGFALSDTFSTQFLTDLANVGGGDVYSANTAGELVTVFENILTAVKNDPTSFVSPALATNAFNRLLSRDEVYFGLFTPNLARAWEGNVKKYKICTEISPGCSQLGTILDAFGTPAIDSANDKFKDTAQSIWSNEVDGKLTVAGGAGAEIDTLNSQTLFTDQNNSGLAVNGQLLSSTGFKLTNNNWDSTELSTMRSAICPTPSTAAGSDCEKRMLFLLGKISSANPDTDVNGVMRWSVNDVLHSSPAVITYNGTDTNNDGEIDTFFDRLLYGTNDGSLHMVDGFSGAEVWRYMPSNFWGQQQNIFSNAEGNHIYGLDVTPTIQIIDDGDGIIETSTDIVRAFIASRRGSNNIYALDLTADIGPGTTDVVPRFLWRITGGSGDFARLGQTWSQPTIAKIAIFNGTETLNKEVLIFGGGYDASLDNPGTYSPSDHANTPFMGNAIYIVDPENGNKLLSISSAASADITVSDMDYSIPSVVRALDSNSDGVDDRLYVGDTGGQVWRVDLSALDLSSSSPSPAGQTRVGKLAEISVPSTTNKRRRFFEAPSVVQVRDTTFSNEANYDYILIGTGYRPHPLNTQVEDRFYAFRDFHTDANELGDDDGNNVSDAVDGYPQASGVAYNDSNLINITTTTLDSTIAGHRASSGWFYDFTQAGTVGEKVLSPPITTGGAVTFTTFAPEATASAPDPCGASLGLGTAYNFDILSAGAALDFDGDGAITNNDRTFELASGIPSGVVPVFTTQGVIGIVGVEGGAKQLGTIAELTGGRSFWSEESEF